MELREYRRLVTKAHGTLSSDIMHKRITRDPCCLCGNLKVEGHHLDYHKPRKVIWLCRKHHRAQHRQPTKKIKTQWLGQRPLIVPADAIGYFVKTRARAYNLNTI